MPIITPLRGTALKPHIVPVKVKGRRRSYLCGAVNARGRFVSREGHTPEEAYNKFISALEELRAAGLLWEVFP